MTPVGPTFRSGVLAVATTLLLIPSQARAENGHAAWLRYAPLAPAAA